jgi:hypothetical protein
LYGSDHYLIWTEGQPGVAGSSDVVGLELATGRRILVAAGAGAEQALGLAGVYAVWQEYQENPNVCVRAANLYRKALPGGSSIFIARSESLSNAVAMLGDAVAWVTHGCDEDAHVRLWTGGPVQPVWDTHDGFLSPPALNEGYVAWADVLSDRLMIYNRTTGRTSEVGVQDTGYFVTPALHGDTLFWSDGTLRYLRLDGGGGGIIMQDARGPAVYGNTLLWRDAGGIWGARLPDLTPTRLVAGCGYGASCALTVAGGWLVWGPPGAWQTARLDALFAQPPAP